MQKLGAALIGYTGFVGSNILAQHPFDWLYNSKNIEDIQNKNFDLAVCAAAPGTKWVANKNPRQDLAAIEKLINNLKSVKCNKFVLISTIDVYSPVNGVDEDTVIDKKNLQPYAKHRRALEEFVEENFESVIIRLPGIFGNGLKKNVIFNLIHNSPINQSPESIFQYYWLDHIWADINKTLDNQLKLINFAAEPITLKELADKIFGQKLSYQKDLPTVYYEMRTKYAPIWAMDKPYLYSKDQVLEDLKAFIKTPTP